MERAFRIYNFLTSEKAKRRIGRVVTFSIASFFLLGTVFNVHADDAVVNCGRDLYVEVSEVSQAATDSTTFDVDKAGGNTFTSALTYATRSIYPQGCMGFSENAANNPNITAGSAQGLVGFMNNNVMAFQKAPATVDVQYAFASDWVPNYGDKASAVYAQDGYQFLLDSGLSDLWEFSRGVAYTAFVLVLIAAGFMIMFRHKIGGQMAVTVFNTIPNVVVGLILVTFSFYIVGLMINIGAVLVVVSKGLLGNTSSIVIESPFSLLSAFMTGSVSYIWDGANQMVDNALSGMISTLAKALLVVAFGFTAIATFPIALIVLLLLSGIVIYVSVRVYITLIKAYVGILIDTVLGPIIIALGTIPGQSTLRDDWFRRLIKNILTFPGVFLLVNLGVFFLSQDLNLGFPKNLAGGDPTSNDDGWLNILFKAIVALYLWSLAAEVPKFLDDMLPVNGGKNAIEGFKGAAKGAFGRIPIIKDMV